MLALVWYHHHCLSFVCAWLLTTTCFSHLLPRMSCLELVNYCELNRSYEVLEAKVLETEQLHGLSGMHFCIELELGRTEGSLCMSDDLGHSGRTQVAFLAQQVLSLSSSVLRVLTILSCSWSFHFDFDFLCLVQLYHPLSRPSQPVRVNVYLSGERICYFVFYTTINIFLQMKPRCASRKAKLNGIYYHY